jgi:hypothetical protein
MGRVQDVIALELEHRSGGHDVVRNGPDGGLGTTRDIEFEEKPADEVACGMGRDAELAADFPIGEAGGEAIEDLLLALLQETVTLAAKEGTLGADRPRLFEGEERLGGKLRGAAAMKLDVVERVLRRGVAADGGRAGEDQGQAADKAGNTGGRRERSVAGRHEHLPMVLKTSIHISRINHRTNILKSKGVMGIGPEIMTYRYALLRIASSHV